MKNNKCPYCSKRFSYISVFASRRKSQYVCERCGKESRIAINNKVIIAFAACALVSVAIMAGWITAGLSNNPLGILFVAVPLIVFAVISPNFVKYVPLKKYKKSMEAKRAGIEYSDNLITSELEENQPVVSGLSGDTQSEFRINADVFNTIKAERAAARERLSENELISDSSEIKKAKEKTYSENTEIKNESYLSGSSDAPLKKIHSESSRYPDRTRHYIQNKPNREPKKSDTNRYSANRKF